MPQRRKFSVNVGRLSVDFEFFMGFWQMTNPGIWQIRPFMFFGTIKDLQNDHTGFAVMLFWLYVTFRFTSKRAET